MSRAPRILAVLMLLTLSGVVVYASAGNYAGADWAYAATTALTPEVLDPEGGEATTGEDPSRYDQLLRSVSPETRAQLEDLIAEIAESDRQLEIAAEEYNYARGRLRTVNQDIEQAEVDYRAISEAYATQSEIVGARMRAFYKQGVAPEIAILFSADSLTGLFEVVQYVVESGGQDAEQLNRLRQEKVALEETLTSLRRDKAEAESLEFELKARKIEVGYRVAERQATLKQKSPRLMALLERAQRAENQDESAIYFRLVSGGLGNVEVEAGSPVETALAYRDIPYVWGGASKRGMDCSGLVLYVFAQHGITLPHHSATQAKLGTEVVGELQPGDLVFFGSPVHHVGIYVGGGYYVHAPHTGDVVRIAKLSGRQDLSAARRLDWQVRTDPIR